MDDTEPTQKPTHLPLRRRTKWLINLGIITLLVALVLAYSLTKINQPVEGTIVHATPPATTDKQPSLKQLSTAYYSLHYPARYRLQPRPANSASLDAEVLTFHQEPGIGTDIRITLNVTNIPAGGVTEDSSYNLFKAHPELYILTEETNGGDTTFVAVRTDSGYQKSILWPHGNYLLTINLVASAPSDSGEQDLRTIISNLRF